MGTHTHTHTLGVHHCRFGTEASRIFDRRTVNVCKQEFKCKYTRVVCQSEGPVNTHTHTHRILLCVYNIRIHGFCAVKGAGRGFEGRGKDGEETLWFSRPPLADFAFTPKSYCNVYTYIIIQKSLYTHTGSSTGSTDTLLINSTAVVVVHGNAVLYSSINCITVEDEDYDYNIHARARFNLKLIEYTSVIRIIPSEYTITVFNYAQKPRAFSRPIVFGLAGANELIQFIPS